MVPAGQISTHPSSPFSAITSLGHLPWHPQIGLGVVFWAPAWCTSLSVDYLLFTSALRLCVTLMVISPAPPPSICSNVTFSMSPPFTTLLKTTAPKTVFIPSSALSSYAFPLLSTPPSEWMFLEDTDSCLFWLLL